MKTNKKTNRRKFGTINKTTSGKWRARYKFLGFEIYVGTFTSKRKALTALNKENPKNY